MRALGGGRRLKAHRASTGTFSYTRRSDMQCKDGWAALAVSAMAALAVGDIESIDPQQGAEFGSSFATEGTVFAVGAPGYLSGVGRVETGSFVHPLRAVIPAPFGSKTLGFGHAVALKPGWCLVGAPASIGGGGAWVFGAEPLGWTGGERLTPPFGEHGDEFGAAVGLSTEFAFVGAPRSDGDGGAEGVVHVFEQLTLGHGWHHRMVLHPGEIEDSPMLWADFGRALATDSTHLAVGAPGMHEGVCYVYTLPGIGHLPQTTPHISRPVRVEAPEGIGSSFGASIDVEGSILVVGAPHASADGVVVVYRRSGISWNIEAVLEPSDGEVFGSSVAVEGNAIVVGDPDASDGGRAWLYVGVDGTWLEQSPAIASGTGDHLGAAVGVGACGVLAGAPGVGGEGVVYCADVVLCPDCNANLVCDSDEISSNPNLDCNSDGLIDVCQMLADCDNDGVPDECDDVLGDHLPRCLPIDGTMPIEVLVLEDTSGSTGADRAEACATISAALASFSNVSVAWCHIGAGGGGTNTCVEGDEFPIPTGTAVPDCWEEGDRVVGGTEDWGDAVSVACSTFPWGQDGLRFVLVLTDEGPSNGTSGGDCGVDDVVSLELATSLAASTGVQLFPVALPGTGSCLFDGLNGLMAQLAGASVGQVLDARNLSAFDVLGVIESLAWSIDTSPYVEVCSSCLGDVNGDGWVDSADLLSVISAWGTADEVADLNADGIVDSMDLLEVISGWGACG
jgi:hypothetical protein